MPGRGGRYGRAQAAVPSSPEACPRTRTAYLRRGDFAPSDDLAQSALMPRTAAAALSMLKVGSTSVLQPRRRGPTLADAALVRQPPIDG